MGFDGTKALDTPVDISTIIGLIAAALLVVGSILLGGELSAFIDVPSLLIVGGGTGAGEHRRPVQIFERIAATQSFFAGHYRFLSLFLSALLLTVTDQ